MNLRVMLLFLVATLAVRAQDPTVPPTNQWRAFTKADGLAENGCVTVTIGAGGNVLVGYARSNLITVLDGYEMKPVPAPANSHGRVYESPGGQLWTVAPEGLQEFREGEWILYRVPEIAALVQAGRTNNADPTTKMPVGLVPLRSEWAKSLLDIVLLPVRQGRVLILLPDLLLQLNAEDPDNVQVERLGGVDQTTLGGFTGMTPARDGGLWISGVRGAAKIAGPLRQLSSKTPWAPAAGVPAEIRENQLAAISPEELSVRRIFDAAMEPGGTLWLATSDGLFRRAPAVWQTEVALGGERPPPEATEPPAPAMVLPPDIAGRGEWPTRFRAQNGDLWLGGRREIAWRHQNSWQIFASTNQLGPEEVVAFAEAPDGRFWCATPGKIWAFDGKNWLALRGGFEHINRLCGARDGTLWVATDDGLHRFTHGAWIANGPEDGLPSAIVHAVSEDKLGHIRAVTAGGASEFHPEADPDPPKTLVRSTADPEQTFREGSPVNLAYSGRDKWKQTVAGRLNFSYRLDERDWTPFYELREVFLTDLPVGKHYFQVRAMDRNGNLDPKPAQLQFVVVLPWYRETRLVLILAVALVVAVGLAGVAFNRHRLLRRSYAVVEDQVAARTRELELANRELLHSQKMNALGTLAAGIAHDFNNILSIVKGSAQIIEDNVNNPEKIRTRADRIKTVVEQGAGIVQAMLGFSRSSDDQPAPCDLNIVVADTLKLLGDRFRHEVEVRCEHVVPLPEIPAAKDLIQQILLNLIFNAAESMTQPKQVFLTVQAIDQLPADIVLLPARAASYISIAVRDCGSGITAENRPRIFEPFFTTKALSTRRGTGLGLSMVYELAKKMKAGLAVDSIVGQGSTFTLIVPVHDLPPR